MRRGHTPDFTVEAIRQWFAVPKSAAKVAAALYRANGELLTYGQIEGRTGLGRGAIHAAVVRLRAAMEPFSYENEYGVGYRLTDTGLAECTSAILDAERRVTCVGKDAA